MDMSKYKGMFIDESREHLKNMNKLLLELEKNPTDSSNIDVLFREAHSLKGMSASMSYNNIADLSHALEDLLDCFRKKELEINTGIINILFDGVDILEKQVEEIASDTPTQIDTTPLLTELKAVKEKKQPKVITAIVKEPASIAPAELKKKNDEIFSIDPSQQKHCKNLLEKGLKAYHLKIEISPEARAFSPRAFIIAKRVMEIGEVLNLKPKIEEIKAGKCGRLIESLLFTDKNRDEIDKKLSFIPEIEKIENQAIDLEDINFSTPPKKIVKPSPKTVIKPIKEKSSTVRVDTSLLDTLINIVGELIINRSSLFEVNKKLDSEELTNGLKQLDILVKDLQTKIMSVRMLPLRVVTDQLPRMIRDLSKKSGKEINFEIVGDEIELDRAILEDLGDPLIHILRNCVDHGIETPKERSRKGKSEKGLIRLTAYREKDLVFIEIKDNGQGINPEKIRAIALSKGIITEEQSANLDNTHISLLIFAPGFSTAEKVTDISGRGVGMDVVKSKIEALGGSINIESEIEMGSTITLILPLTMAIIQILLVRLNNQRFGIPISQTYKSVEVRADEIKMSQKQKVFLLGDEFVPLLSLEDVLEVPNNEKESSPIREVIVVEIRNKKIGLIVDELMGKCEAVIKPLGQPLEKISGLSGVTILGDGEPVLILDVANLI